MLGFNNFECTDTDEFNIILLNITEDLSRFELKENARGARFYWTDINKRRLSREARARHLVGSYCDHLVRTLEQIFNRKIHEKLSYHQMLFF